MQPELKALIEEFILHTGPVEWQELTDYVEKNLLGTAKNWFYYWIYNAIEVCTNDWQTFAFSAPGVYYQKKTGRAIIALFYPGEWKTATRYVSDCQPLKIESKQFAILEQYLSYSSPTATNPFLFSYSSPTATNPFL